jgi:hypothetical protein
MKKYFRYLIVIFISIVALPAYAQQKFTGTFSNGYKGAKLSFILSADKRSISNFTFSGYWRCGGSTENITAGPKRSFPVTNGKVDAVITDPEKGGASAFRFKLNGMVSGATATGSFRMSITGLSCDTYELKWTAASK